MKLLVATNNQDKQREFSQILANSSLDLVFPEDVGLADLEVEESGSSFVANARLKAWEFARRSGLKAVADDSGLEVAALGGEPGVFSKRFSAGNDQDRCQKILNLLTEEKQRQAQFRSVLVVADPQAPDQDLVFEGIFAGTIAFAPEGEAGFGYDPIFIPEGQTQTVASLGQVYKNQHSHRAQAIQKLAIYLENQSHA